MYGHHAFYVINTCHHVCPLKIVDGLYKFNN